MTEQEIIDNNILIAEYMNYPRDRFFYTINVFNITTYNTRRHHREQLCFHLSWDWLIPVYSKIMESNSIEDDEIFKCMQDMEEAIYTNRIDCGFESIVETIKWLNLNNKV